MTPRKPLQPGDRVRIYRSDQVDVGDVCEVHPDGTLTVRVTGLGFIDVHPKQCRRLIKRKRMELTGVWQFSAEHSRMVFVPDAVLPGSFVGGRMTFREVRQERKP